MGADLLSGVDRRMRLRLHRLIGRVGRGCPLSVLCLRRDLPGPADPRPHDLQGLGGNLPVMPGTTASVSDAVLRTAMPGPKKCTIGAFFEAPDAHATSSIVTLSG